MTKTKAKEKTLPNKLLRAAVAEHSRLAIIGARAWTAAWWRLGAAALATASVGLSKHEGRVMARATAGAALEVARALLPEQEWTWSGAEEACDVFEAGTSYASVPALVEAMRQMAEAVEAEALPPAPRLRSRQKRAKAPAA